MSEKCGILRCEYFIISPGTTKEQKCVCIRQESMNIYKILIFSQNLLLDLLYQFHVQKV